MVSTDTVVGIVGAALLAVVMVGVFVYEYNNEGTIDPIGGDGVPLDPVAAFQARHPRLNATGDLDGDGKSNLEDDDMDNDGRNNTVDPDVVYTQDRGTGTLGPSLPPALLNEWTTQVVVEEGVEGVTATVTVTSAQPHNLLVQLLGPDGDLLDDQSSTAGSPNSFTLDAGEAPEPGTYTIRVSQHTAGAGATFTASATVDYGVPVQADGSDKGAPGEIQA